MKMPDTLLTIEERLAVWQDYLSLKEPKMSWPEFLNRAGDAKTKREFLELLETYQNVTKEPGVLFYIPMDDYQALRKWALAGKEAPSS